MTKEGRKIEKLRMIRLHTSSCDDGYCETQFALNNTYKTAPLGEGPAKERIKKNKFEYSREKKKRKCMTTAHDAGFFHHIVM
jgi:hypothetical protein